MNSQTILPKIFLTTDPNLVDAFSAPTVDGTAITSFSQFIDSYIGTSSYNEDSYIYLTIDNTNIVNFEFSMGGNSSSKLDPNITLEFLALTEEFEFNLLKRLFYNVKKDTNFYKSSDSKLRFFISFGVGDNLSYFSPFMVCTLFSSATFQNFDQPRTTQLNFGIGSAKEILRLVNEEQAIVEPSRLTNLKFKGQSFGAFTLPKREFGSKIKDILKNNLDTIQGSKVNADDPAVVNLLNHDGNTNSDLIGNYIFGFERLDFMYKEAITNFLKTAYLQDTNVFFVSESLPRLALKGSKYETINTAVLLNSEAPKYGDPLPGAASYSRISWDNYIKPLEFIVNVLNDLLGTTTNLPTYNRDTGYFVSNLCRVELECSVNNSENLKEVPEAVLEKVKYLITGLMDLTGENVVEIEESNVEVIRDFYNNLRGGAWTAYTEDTDSSKELELKPLHIIGPEKLVNALLYGRRAPEVEDTSYNVLKLGQPLPTNKYAQYRAYGKKINSSQDTQTTVADKSPTTAISDLYTEDSPEVDTGKLLERILIEDETLFEDFNSQRYPVFRYNVKNANVLSLKAENTNIFNTFLNAGINRVESFLSSFSKTQRDSRDVNYSEFKKAAVKSTQDLLDAFGAGDYDRFVKITKELGITDLKDRGILLGLVGNKIKGSSVGQQQLLQFALQKKLISPEAVRDPGNQEEDLAKILGYDDKSIEMITKIISYLVKNENLDENLITVQARSRVTFGGDATQAGIADYYAYLYDFISNLSFSVEITTLPLFKISGYEFVNGGFGAILLANRTSVIGNTTNKVFDQFLSGPYIITGVKHVINSTTCESTFYLQRKGRSP